MVWVDNISDLEYYNHNPDYDCYADIITSPRDILLQAFTGTGTSLFSTVTINVLSVDGTFLEDATSYFAVCWLLNPVGSVSYNYTNINCLRYSPAMIANKCFILEVIQPFAMSADGQITGFHKYTQKYQLINTLIFARYVLVFVDGGGNLATLCSEGNTDGLCNPLIKMSCAFDCMDAFNGDFYGDGILLESSAGGGAFTFIRQFYIQGMIRKLPTAIKRTVSINCRTQRAERTIKYLLSAFTSFPEWKVQEIESMLLAQHLFLDGREYQSEGGTPFEQVGKPKNCVYAYKLGMELQDCFEWQAFGCTPICSPLYYYYPIL